MDRKLEYLEYWKKWIGNHQADKKALDAYAGNPPEIEEEVELCDGCEEPTRLMGEDCISVCENCGIVESYTHMGVPK